MDRKDFKKLDDSKARLAPGQCRRTLVHYKFSGPPRATGQGPQGGTSLKGTDVGEPALLAVNGRNAEAK